MAVVIPRATTCTMQRSAADDGSSAGSGSASGLFELDGDPHYAHITLKEEDEREEDRVEVELSEVRSNDNYASAMQIPQDGNEDTDSSEPSNGKLRPTKVPLAIIAIIPAVVALLFAFAFGISMNIAWFGGWLGGTSLLAGSTSFDLKSRHVNALKTFLASASIACGGSWIRLFMRHYRFKGTSVWCHDRAYGIYSFLVYALLVIGSMNWIMNLPYNSEAGALLIHQAYCCTLVDSVTFAFADSSSST